MIFFFLFFVYIKNVYLYFFFFFSSRRRHTRLTCDWSSDVCSSDLENLQRLARDGREGAYGFYEAVDYTPSRLPPDESSVTVRSYMAHHQGMSLLALVSLLRDLPMQRRFMARPLLKSADLLLQERLPKTEASVLPEDLELEEARPRFGEGEDVMRVFKSPISRTPEIHLLSNGRYHVAIL